MGSTSGRLARQIVSDLRAAGQSAYLVGGCVRDELLGLTPKDYDVATSAQPEQVLQLFPHAELVGAHFGVMLVRGGGEQVEVATYRSDGVYEDGRHPEAVTFETEPKRDALRRDFTINALFLDPLSGEVLDFVGGQKDLHEGVVRAIGDPRERFEEDHLRMLRAVRFAARFRYPIEAGTYSAMRELAPLIHRVSAERVRDELLRILTEGNARAGCELLDGCGLLKEVLPEVHAFHGVEQPPEFHPEGDVWTHVMMMLEQMGEATPSLALGVLLHDVGKPPTFRVAERIRFDGHVEVGVEMARGILARLRCSKELTSRVCALVENHMRFKDVHRMKASTLKRFLRMDGFEEHLALHRLDCLSSNRQLENYEYARRMWESMPEEALRPPRLLTGEDLITAGYEPGPLFSHMLRAVEDAQLEGRASNRDEALRVAMAVAESERS
ncbi:MAG: CCA tRNA nucleotidyltransferase [Acidobacteria bacterium]|nr:CCA tRNA nucleotidyltransferase [Acidobacteriota bacterium]